MDTTLVSQYALAGIGTALIMGIFLGYTLRAARARRERDSLQTELKTLKQQLTATAVNGTGSPPAPIRWTGTEVAAVIGAFGTLLGALGALYGSYQGQLKTNLTTAEGDLEGLRQAVRETFVYDVSTWQRLTPSTLATKKGKPVTVDNKDVTLDCDGVLVRYLGNRPAIARCGPGTASLRLDEAARVFLVPEQDP